MIENIKRVCISTLLLSCMICANAQTNAEKETERMIRASQGSASPLVFKTDEGRIMLVDPSNFNDNKETVVRAGLGNFFAKLATGKPVTVGYIGGSITQAHYGYRLQSAKYIQSLYPATSFQFLNAGVSGTGTDLGACRIKDQLLIHQPDLIFIEFVVNGGYREGLEGMIRQIIKNNPKTEICLLYTIISGQTKTYNDGQIPEKIMGFEQVADYYGLPSIHLGMEAAQLEKQGKVIWKGDPNYATDQLLFSIDGVHPSIEGGNLYAAAIARGINKLKAGLAESRDHTLPKKLFDDNWEDAKMIDPIAAATFSKGWTKIVTKDSEPLKQFESWFAHLMHTDEPGSSFTFKFDGTAFGFYDLGGPEVGEVTITLDGKPITLQEVNENGYRFYKQFNTTNSVPLINRFNVFCNNRYRGQYEFIQTEPGIHTVTVSLSTSRADKAKILGQNQLEDINQHPEKYDRTAIYLGKILVKGDIVK